MQLIIGAVLILQRMLQVLRLLSWLFSNPGEGAEGHLDAVRRARGGAAPRRWVSPLAASMSSRRRRLQQVRLQNPNAVAPGRSRRRAWG